MKVPAIIASSIICLMVGIALGAGGATYFGFTVEKVWPTGAQANEDGDQKGPQTGPKMPKGAGPGGPGGADKGIPKGPSAKTQLTALVAKLDVLTQKPLTVSLDDDQKKKVQEELEGLDALADLSEDDAKKRLDGLLKVLEDQKEPLGATGFRWPGEKTGAAPAATGAPNPFQEELNARHLQSLQKRLGKS
jgi:hypothetical protein